MHKRFQLDYNIQKVPKNIDRRYRNRSMNEIQQQKCKLSYQIQVSAQTVPASAVCRTSPQGSAAAG